MKRTKFHIDAREILKEAAETVSRYNFEAVSPVEYLCAAMNSKGFLNVYLKTKEIEEEEISWISKEILDSKSEDLSEDSEEDEEVRKAYIKEFKKASIIDISDEDTIPITLEMEEIIKDAEKMSIEEDGEDIVYSNHILAAIVKYSPDLISDVFGMFGIDSKDVMRDLKNIVDVILYPEEIRGCLKDITLNIPFNSECCISGRERETEEMIRVLLKKTKRNVIIVGEAGVGKTALVEKLAHLIRSDKCPCKLQKIHLIQLDVNGLIAGTIYRGQAEERFVQLINFLEWNKDVILFIDEVHTILGAGNCNGSSLDLSNSLKPILARDDVRVIGATTIDEYEKYFNNDMALKRRFEKVEVKEPTFEEVPQMIAKKVELLEKYHNVEIDRKTIDYVITLSACFRFTGIKNPDRTLDAIDKAMADAEMKGKTKVTPKNVKAAFMVKMDMFKQMSLEYKTSTAYHEAGHYLVARYCEMFSKKIHVRAVSILPANDYLGINVFEYLEHVDSSSRQCFIEQIAVNLAGRIAEKKFTKTESAGASSDLDNATHIAYILLTNYGMGKEDSFKNRVYNKETSYGKGQDKLDTEISSLISEGYTIAEKILDEHERELKMIVARLIKHGILTESTLNNICKEDNEKKGKINS